MLASDRPQQKDSGQSDAGCQVPHHMEALAHPQGPLHDYDPCWSD